MNAQKPHSPTDHCLSILQGTIPSFWSTWAISVLLVMLVRHLIIIQKHEDAMPWTVFEYHCSGRTNLIEPGILGVSRLTN